MDEKRIDCPMRHENGNCTVAGGFCTSVNDEICEALHNAYDCGIRRGIKLSSEPSRKNQHESNDKLLRKTKFDRIIHVKDFIYSNKTEEPICEDGTLYIADIGLIAYNCPCGCGSVVTLPLSPVFCNGWKCNETAGMVTLSPSVHCPGFQCKSHYFIKDNKIIWCD